MIRFGINAGSLDKNILAKHREPNSLALAEEAERVVKFLQN